MNFRPHWEGSALRKKALPADSISYSKQAFLEEASWRRRRERMSLTLKIEGLDRLPQIARSLPKLELVNGEAPETPVRREGPGRQIQFESNRSVPPADMSLKIG